LLHSHPI